MSPSLFKMFIRNYSLINHIFTISIHEQDLASNSLPRFLSQKPNHPTFGTTLRKKTFVYIKSFTDRSVSFYQKSSVWLDILTSRCWDRNPVDSDAISSLYP